MKAGTPSAFGERLHTTAYTPKQERFGWGWYHYPRSVPHVLETLRGQMSERQTLPLLDPGREVLSKNAESLRNSDALMRVAVPRCRGPAGLRDLFLFLPKLRLLRSAHTGPFRVCEAGVVSLPSARFARCRTAGRRIEKGGDLRFGCGPY